jgi:hypothetical protein
VWPNARGNRVMQPSYASVRAKPYERALTIPWSMRKIGVLCWVRRRSTCTDASRTLFRLSFER